MSSGVAGYDIRVSASRCLSDGGVGDVTAAGSAKQMADLVGRLLGQGHDRAAAQQPPKLHLIWKAAGLGDDSSGHGGYHAGL